MLHQFATKRGPFLVQQDFFVLIDALRSKSLRSTSEVIKYRLQNNSEDHLTRVDDTESKEQIKTLDVKQTVT
jgi:hypothetical protein